MSKIARGLSQGDRGQTSEATIHLTARIDQLDAKIIDLVVLGYVAKEISNKIGRPLSTVQRRVRLLQEGGIVKTTTDLSYTKLGLKYGNLLVYMRNGDVGSVAGSIAGMQGILGVAVHIGSSDIIALYLYRESANLLGLTSKIRQLEGVERVAWSEEVYQVPLTNGASLGPMLLGEVQTSRRSVKDRTR